MASVVDVRVVEVAWGVEAVVEVVWQSSMWVVVDTGRVDVAVEVGRSSSWGRRCGNWGVGR